MMRNDINFTIVVMAKSNQSESIQNSTLSGVIASHNNLTNLSDVPGLNNQVS